MGAKSRCLWCRGAARGGTGLIGSGIRQRSDAARGPAASRVPGPWNRVGQAPAGSCARFLTGRRLRRWKSPDAATELSTIPTQMLDSPEILQRTLLPHTALTGIHFCGSAFCCDQYSPNCWLTKPNTARLATPSTTSILPKIFTGCDGSYMYDDAGTSLPRSADVVFGCQLRLQEQSVLSKDDRAAARV